MHMVKWGVQMVASESPRARGCNRASNKKVNAYWDRRGSFGTCGLAQQRIVMEIGI